MLRGFTPVFDQALHSVAQDVHQRLARAVKHRERRGGRVGKLPRVLRLRRGIRTRLRGYPRIFTLGSALGATAVFINRKRRSEPPGEPLTPDPSDTRHPRTAARALHRRPAPARQPPQRLGEEPRVKERRPGQKTREVRRRREPQRRPLHRVGDALDELVHDPRAQRPGAIELRE